MKTRTTGMIFSTMAASLMVWFGPTIAFAANNQEQVEFSGAGIGTFGGDGSTGKAVVIANGPS